jgi:uncharacterized protein (DUF58 family)
MASRPSAPGTDNYLDPVTLSKISSLELLARMVVEGVVTGLHKSPYQGFNVEFSEHRPYNPGDDIRHIDWKAQAKLDRFYVKKFEEETNLRGYIFLDASASMGFQSGGGVSKLDYGRYLAVSLAYLMLLQRDNVGLSVFGSSVRRFVPPRGNRSHLQAIIEELKAARPEGETRIASTLADLATRISRRGLVILVSDLLEDHEAVLVSLRHLRHRKNDVILFQILDPHEIEIPWKGYLRLTDMEDQSSLATDPSWLRREYGSRIERFLEAYRQGCLEEGIDHVVMTTDQPLDEALSVYLASRMRRPVR